VPQLNITPIQEHAVITIEISVQLPHGPVEVTKILHRLRELAIAVSLLYDSDSDSREFFVLVLV
jgi:hypothetical protein